MNGYYNTTGTPTNHGPGSSAAIRAEFALIQTAFDKMPLFAGNAGKPVGINATEDGFVALTALENVSVGVLIPAAGAFTTLHAGGLATMASTLEVAGTVTAAGFIGPHTGSVQGDVVGNVTGNVIGNVTGNVTGNLSGNATTSTSAQTAASATSAATANFANSVNWTGVIGRPTALSQFTNDMGYVTTTGAAAAGGLTGTTLAPNVVNSSLTSLGTIANLQATVATVANTLDVWGQVHADGPSASTIATATFGLGALRVQGAGGATAAFIQFHRPGFFGGYFGIDSDNQLKWGGYSMGAVANLMLHSGNISSYAPSPSGVGATGTWPINITGNANISNTAGNAGTVNNYPSRGDNTLYPVLWAPNGGNVGQPTYSCDTVLINSATGRLQANSVVTVDRVFGHGAGLGLGSIFIATAGPSGGQIGDIWFRY